MSERKMKGWFATSIKKEQYNGLQLLAARQRRPITQYLGLLLEKAGVPELTDEELESRLKHMKAFVLEVEAR